MTNSTSKTAEQIEIEVMGDALSEPYMDGLKQRTVEAAANNYSTMFVDTQVLTALIADRDELRRRDGVEREKRLRWGLRSIDSAREGVDPPLCDVCGHHVGYRSAFYTRQGMGPKQENVHFTCGNRVILPRELDERGISQDEAVVIMQAYQDKLSAGRHPYWLPVKFDRIDLRDLHTIITALATAAQPDASL